MTTSKISHTNSSEAKPSSINIEATLIVATYNAPKFHELMLHSVSKQTNLNFELIVADDGSKPDIKEIYNNVKDSFPVPITHIWHEDSGWRKAKILNDAIKAAKGDLLIFIDGDCVIARDFIDDHIRVYRKEKGDYVLMGRRVDMDRPFTESITIKNIDKKLFSFPRIGLFLSYLLGDTRNFFRTYSVKNVTMRKLLKADNVADLLGANCSLPRKTIYKINGFNEECAHEDDTDLFVRLRNSKFKLIGMKYYAVMHHLYHDDRQDRADIDERNKIVLDKRNYYWTPNGLVKLAERPER